LTDGFDISGVEILPGGYTNWEYRVFGRSAGRRKVSMNGGFGWGGFWNGSQNGYDARVTLRPGPGWSLSTNFERNNVDLPQGDFSANVYELEVDWNASPWVSATSQLQYDNQSELVGLFTRVRWIVTPG